MWQYFEDSEEQQRLTGRWIANALKRFGFKRGRRQALGTTYILDPEKVKDLMQRYEVRVDSEDETTETTNGDSLTTLPSHSSSSTQTSLDNNGLLTEEDKIWIDKQTF